MATDFLITEIDQEDRQNNKTSYLIIDRERKNISSEIIQSSTNPFLLSKYIPEKGGNPLRVMVKKCNQLNQFINVILLCWWL